MSDPVFANWNLALNRKDFNSCGDVILVMKHDRKGFWAPKEINTASNDKLSQKTIPVGVFSKRFKSIILITMNITT